MSSGRAHWGALLVAALGLGACPARSQTPYRITFEIGDSEFHDGDEITVTELSGNRPRLEPGGTYHVRGHYRLQSRERAGLLFSLTTVGHVTGKPVQSTSDVPTMRGEGDFDLTQTIDEAGYLHVSFYTPDGWSVGCVYFGSNEWLLKKKSWPCRSVGR